MFTSILVFQIDKTRCALPLNLVERVIPLVNISNLPKAPEIIIGLINLAGKIIPIIDLRKKFQLPDHKTEINDKIIIARSSRRVIGFLVDEVENVIENSEQQYVKTDSIYPDLEYVKGVVKIKGEIILIYDVDTFLSLEEDQQLDKALTEQ